MIKDFGECREIIEALLAVFDDLDRYVFENDLWDDDVVQALHLKRQQLTAQLHKAMPSPMPPVLEELVVCLHEKTKHTLSLITTSQQETRDAVFKLQNYRKAKGVYQSVNAG